MLSKYLLTIFNYTYTNKCIGYEELLKKAIYGFHQKHCLQVNIRSVMRNNDAANLNSHIHSLRLTELKVAMTQPSNN